MAGAGAGAASQYLPLIPLVQALGVTCGAEQRVRKHVAAPQHVGPNGTTAAVSAITVN